MNEARKLEEAEYFLAEMHRLRETRKSLVYNLSAYLAAARSVLQYASLEATSKPGGQKWYDDHINQSKVLPFFKDKRDLNIHEEPVEPSAHVGIEVTETLPLPLSESITIEITQGGAIVGHHHWESEPPKPTLEEQHPARIRTIYKFDDWNGAEDVFDLCRLYLDELKRVVGDGQARGFLTP